MMARLLIAAAFSALLSGCTVVAVYNDVTVTVDKRGAK